MSDKVRGVYVTNLKHVKVSDLSRAERVIAHAQRKRSVCKTSMNDQSSRSHSIFSLTVHGINAKEQKEVRGSLHLCDLAGSERVRKSKVEGVALQEAKAINKSLSQLSTVMQAIKRKEKHVPYRDSKLTRLLQACLCNAGRTVFMINVAPAPSSLHETHNSLVFARTVSQCELGKAEASVRRFNVAEARERQRNAAHNKDARPQTASKSARHGKPPATPMSSRKVKRQLFTPRTLLTPNEKMLQKKLDEQKTLTESKVMAAREFVMTEMQSIVKRNVSAVQYRHEEEMAEMERMHAQEIARMEERYTELKTRLTQQLRLKQSEIDRLTMELEGFEDEPESEDDNSYGD